MKSFFNDILKFFTNRLFIIFTITCILFYIIISRLFNLQIVNTETYAKRISNTTSKKVVVKAPRGIIVDKYGRPLAKNKSSFVLKLDHSMFNSKGKPLIANQNSEEEIFVDEALGIENLNTVLYELVKLLEKNNEKYKDELPISKTEPFEFLFDGNKKSEIEFKQKLGILRNNTKTTQAIRISTKISAPFQKYFSTEQLNHINSVETVNKERNTSKREFYDVESVTATQVIDALRRKYELPEEWTDVEARNVISFLYYFNEMRYLLYAPVTIAENVSNETVAAIEEQSNIYYGVSVETESVREYPYGIYLSNLIGYTGKINNTEYNARTAQSYLEKKLVQKKIPSKFHKYFAIPYGYRGMNYDDGTKQRSEKTFLENKLRSEKIPAKFVNMFPIPYGYRGMIYDDGIKKEIKKTYAMTDIIGKIGLERSFEDNLKGIDGAMTIEVDNLSRKVGITSETPPTQGDKIILTIDADLQVKTYNIIQEVLKKIILNKMNGVSPKEEHYSDKDILTGLINNNVLSLPKIIKSTEGSYSYKAREIILENNPDYYVYGDNARAEANEYLTTAISQNRLKNFEILLIFKEQGIITGTDEYFEQLENGRIGSRTVLTDKILEDEITPQMINLYPSTGSAVLTNVKDGSVIAAVGYPSYDNNLYTQQYYLDKLNNDFTRPQFNRPFSEVRAPGSVFKMISAITGLETGTITTNTTVYDRTVYTAASIPYANCWSSVSHQSVNVIKALEVSCNYFFFELANMMNYKDGSEPNQSIKNLNKYMIEFGLNDKSGVEIPEGSAAPNDSVPRISGPELKEARDGTKWTVGEDIRTAIGQSSNAYTPAVMAKYIATIASKGIRLPLHLMQKVETSSGNLVKEYKPVVEHKVELKDSTWDAVFEGMWRVVYGSNGTANRVLSGFPIEVAGKTGTAEEQKFKPEHTTFGGFAPYTNPEVAIYVIVPYGDSKSVPAPATEIAKEILAEYFNIQKEPEHPIAVNSLVE